MMTDEEQRVNLQAWCEGIAEFLDLGSKPHDILIMGETTRIVRERPISLEELREITCGWWSYKFEASLLNAIHPRSA